MSFAAGVLARLLAALGPAACRWASRAVVGALGGGMLWVIAHGAGPQEGRLIVHVFGSDAEVSVAGETFRVSGSGYELIEAWVRPGAHRLVMRRGPTVLHEEEFEVEAGETRMLSAWDSRGEHPSCGRSAPPARRAGASSHQAGSAADRP